MYALFTIHVVFACHVKSSEMRTQRSLVWLTCSIILLFRWSLVWNWADLQKLNIIYIVLSGFNFISLFWVQSLIWFKLSWDLIFSGGIKNWSTTWSEGTWALELKEAKPTVNRLSNSRKLASSTNLNTSLWSKKSKFWFVCDIYSMIPAVPPWGPPLLTVWNELSSPFHFTIIYLSWKKLINRGIKLSLTPLLIYDLMPKMWDCLSKAWDQSIIFRIMALFSKGEFLSRERDIWFIMLIK